MRYHENCCFDSEQLTMIAPDDSSLCMLVVRD